ncbi:hypothetical protein [Sodalinema gerasimenkoae]|uniref:hypothetical protein n=1 Tax=Sodalinema gerasimenkoae TaxID=2862348 RepID=UPI001356D1D6|nr:hypothetical protein [Sodalinema gerasimenkoae]
MPPSLQRLIQLAQALENSLQQGQSPLDFDQIEQPFQLIATGIEVWEQLYPPEILRQLAQTDPDTLDAWAIALSQTLEQQLALLNTWIPHLSSLPVPQTLQQKLQSYYQDIASISREKSQLLDSASTLLSREQELRRHGQELDQLKQTCQRLNHMEAELRTTDLGQLQQQNQERSQALTPEYEQLQALEQEKAQLDADYAAIQQQRRTLEAEIQRLRSRRQQQDQQTATSSQDLIQLSQAERQRLSDLLASVLDDLEQERQDYQQVNGELQGAIAQFNQYQEQTEAIRSHLQQHYQHNADLSQRLPVNRQTIDPLLNQIRQQLQQIDQELAMAQQHHAESQRKQSFNFSS